VYSHALPVAFQHLPCWQTTKPTHERKITNRLLIKPLPKTPNYTSQTTGRLWRVMIRNLDILRWQVLSFSNALQAKKLESIDQQLRFTCCLLQTEKSDLQKHTGMNAQAQATMQARSEVAW
jgi:hypothetical protein